MPVALAMSDIVVASYPFFSNRSHATGMMSSVDDLGLRPSTWVVPVEVSSITWDSVLRFDTFVH